VEGKPSTFLIKYSNQDFIFLVSGY